MRTIIALGILLIACGSPDPPQDQPAETPKTPTPPKNKLKSETVIDLKEFATQKFPTPRLKKTGKDIDTLYYGKYTVISDKLNQDVSIYMDGMDLNEKPFFGIALHWPELLEMNWFFKSLYKDFIIIDEGTSASGRALYLRDMNTLKSWQFSYSEYAKIKNDKLYFFTPVDDKSIVPTDVECSPEFDYTRFERLMVFDISTEQLSKTNQFICLYDE